MTSRLTSTIRAAIALALLVGFYGFAIAVAAGLLWVAFLATRRFQAQSAQITFFCLTAAWSIVWSLRPRRDEFAPPGPRVTEADQPALMALVAEVARLTKQAMPADVYLSGHLVASVANRGGVMGFGGRRVMVIGLPLLQVLTEAELRAAVAHEFGHYGAGDTEMGRVVYRAHASIARTLEETRGRLIEVVFRWYARAMMRIAMAVSRQQEFAADAFAARAYGPGPLGSALSKLDTAAPLFHAYLAVAVGPVFGAGLRPPIGEGFVMYLSEPGVAAHRAAMQKMLDEVPPHAYQSHPLTSKRIAALSTIAFQRASMTSDRPAIGLLRDVPELESQLYRSPDPEAPLLEPVAWADVGVRALLPIWRAEMHRHAARFQDLDVRALPSTPKDAAALARRGVDPFAKLDAVDEVVGRLTSLLSLAVLVKAVDAGWHLEVAPGRPIDVTRNGESLEPFAHVSALLAGQSSPEAWAAYCAKAGLSGALFVPGDEPRVPTRGHQAPDFDWTATVPPDVVTDERRDARMWRWRAAAGLALTVIGWVVVANIGTSMGARTPRPYGWFEDTPPGWIVVALVFFAAPALAVYGALRAFGPAAATAPLNTGVMTGFVRQEQSDWQRRSLIVAAAVGIANYFALYVVTH